MAGRHHGIWRAGIQSTWRAGDAINHTAMLNILKFTTVCPHLKDYLSYACMCLMSSEDFKFSPFQPLPSRAEFPAGQHSPSCLPWGLAKLVWPMAMPREDGDGVGPKGEGALRAPLGEPEVWMFPAHTHTHTKGLVRLRV